MNLIPAPGYLIVTPQETKSKTPFQVSEDDSKNYSSKVVAVGKDTINEHGVKIITDAKVGDVIIHKEFHVVVRDTKGEFRFVPFTGVIGYIK